MGCDILNCMLEPWEIVLLVVLGLITLYLLFVIMDAIFVGSFLKMFDTHKKAMTVFMNVKYDNVKKLYEIMKQRGVVFDEKFNKLLMEIQRNDFNVPGSEEFKKTNDNLTFIKDEMLFIVRNQQNLEKHEELKLAKENVVQLDSQYRNTIAQYNADVLGYNYWISCFPTRYIWKLIKFKKKDLING